MPGTNDERPGSQDGGRGAEVSRVLNATGPPRAKGATVRPKLQNRLYLMKGNGSPPGGRIVSGNPERRAAGTPAPAEEPAKPIGPARCLTARQRLRYRPRSARRN